jgi:glycosyltransferase involved in cell wall biosynthesis
MPTVRQFQVNAIPTLARRHAPIRVGFVLHIMQVAGAEVLVAETIRRLGPRIEPTVLCLDGVGQLGERLLSEGVPIVPLGRRAGRDWRLVWRLGRELRERDIDVVHAHQYTPFFYAALARAVAKRDARVILTEHGRHFPDVVSPLRRAVNRFALDHLADAVNACCRFSARALAQADGFSARRIEVLENGIELDRYGEPGDGESSGVSRRLQRADFRTKLGLDPARCYIATVARFHPVKDHATLLRGFQQVTVTRADVDLLLIGDGPLRGELQEQTRTLGLAERVRFLGVRSDIPAILKAVDLFALTSVSEAASLTILEAMASRLPVVVTAVGGNPEMVRDGIDGRLVPRGDASAVAAALLQLLDDPATAASMGAAGRARVEEHYQLSQTVENYWRLYQRLCPRKQ